MLESLDRFWATYKHKRMLFSLLPPLHIIKYIYTSTELLFFHLLNSQMAEGWSISNVSMSIEVGVILTFKITTSC